VPAAIFLENRQRFINGFLPYIGDDNVHAFFGKCFSDAEPYAACSTGDKC